jgi:hypothetical protein
MYNSSGARNFEVRLGATRLDTTETGTITTTSTVGIVHPDYNEVIFANDVAIIELPSEVNNTGENCHILINVRLIFLTHEKVAAYISYCTELCL